MKQLTGSQGKLRNALQARSLESKWSSLRQGSALESIKGKGLSLVIPGSTTCFFQRLVLAPNHGQEASASSGTRSCQAPAQVSPPATCVILCKMLAKPTLVFPITESRALSLWDPVISLGRCLYGPPSPHGWVIPLYCKIQIGNMLGKRERKSWAILIRTWIKVEPWKVVVNGTEFVESPGLNSCSATTWTSHIISLSLNFPMYQGMTGLLCRGNWDDVYV